MIVGLLHDVVEDTNFTFESLQNEIELTAEELQALKILTHDKNIPYLEYIAEIRKNSLATEVKFADLRHNMDTSRFTEKNLSADETRLKKYSAAYQLLIK